MKKVKTYKGYIIAECKNGNYKYHIFTKEEYSMGEGFRYSEWSCDSLGECVEWIG
ncbi:hypothetical protein [Paenibacillus sp. Soil724D2]|uniref:hypothetical protein n=1 Tax=Paenibacillus sp. (strain Soil724D2) TaxID=1736392 RepID=UPI000A72E6C6|nr:hypothetical protein [Paenibacillus sp. Soil724D2]